MLSETVKTIIDQFGQKSFYLIGAKNLVALDANTLQFHFMRNQSPATVCEIEYEPAPDSYIVRFKTANGKLVDEVNNIYFDSLHQVFEHHTGLVTTF